MLGNKNGWILAALVLAIEVWLVIVISGMDKIQEPSKGTVPLAKVTLNLPQNPQFMEEVKLPFSPTAIMPNMTKNQDAGPLYREAIRKYLTNINIYERAWDSKEKKFRSLNYKDYPGLDELVQAREFTQMNLFPIAQADDVITYRGFPEALTALYQMGKLAEQLSLRTMDTKKDESKMLMEAVFSVGVKMMQERIRFQEFDNGQRIAREAALGLGMIDPAVKPAAQAMDTAMRDLIRERLNPLWHVISSVDQNVIGFTGGDVFYTVKKSKERMFRIEGILKLGRYKFDVGIPGHGPNQKWARIWTRRIAEDEKEDPYVRKAARLAFELDIETYRTIGS